VFDETDIPVTPGYDGANKIPGYEKCETKSVEFLQRMLERKAALEVRFTRSYGPVQPPHEKPVLFQRVWPAACAAS